MALTDEQKRSVEKIIIESLRNKFQSYNPESINMPFHYRLLGKDRMALYSFIQSLNTTFGTSIFEPIAVVLAKESFYDAQKQVKVGNSISSEAQTVIQQIMNALSIGNDPDKNTEIERIRSVANKGQINRIRTVKVDLYIKDNNGIIYLFDLKTAKPNVGDFIGYKRTLLEWIAVYLLTSPETNIKSYIAIPYNPYEPEPYQRWTLKGMLDLRNELMVAEEFWDFLGGKGTYNDLLDCFEKAGIELRSEIDKHFEKFKK